MRAFLLFFETYKQKGLQMKERSVIMVLMTQYFWKEVWKICIPVFQQEATKSTPLEKGKIEEGS